MIFFAFVCSAIVKDICTEGVPEDTLETKMEKAMVLLEAIPDLDIGRHDHRCIHGIVSFYYIIS